MFTREAVTLIFERSQGIPRTVNVLADNALLTGFAAGQRPVTRQIVLEVCRDFDLRQLASDEGEAFEPNEPPSAVGQRDRLLGIDAEAPDANRGDATADRATDSYASPSMKRWRFF